MHRGRDELHGRGGRELRHRLPAEALLDLGAHVAGDDGPEQRRDVERGEYRHAVADREEEVRGQRHRAWGPAGPEEAREGLVFEEAETHVGRGGGCELHGPAGDERGGVVLDGRGRGVERVGGEIGAPIQHADEGNWFREEEALRAREKGDGRGL